MTQYEINSCLPSILMHSAEYEPTECFSTPLHWSWELSCKSRHARSVPGTLADIQGWANTVAPLSFTSAVGLPLSLHFIPWISVSNVCLSVYTTTTKNVQLDFLLPVSGLCAFRGGYILWWIFRTSPHKVLKTCTLQSIPDFPWRHKSFVLFNKYIFFNHWQETCPFII